jgi:hypothetical protein
VQTGDPGVYQIADDDPATAAVWLPELARILGAKPPRHLPAWLAKVAVGEVGAAAFSEAVSVRDRASLWMMSTPFGTALDSFGGASPYSAQTLPALL